MFNIVAFLSLVLIIILAPVPLGSNRPYAWYALEVLVFTGVFFWIIGEIFSVKKNSPKQVPTWLFGAFMLWLGYILIQCLPLPSKIVSFINPNVALLQAGLTNISVKPVSTLSIDPGLTLGELLKYSAYVSAMFLVLVTVNSKPRLYILVGSLILAGIAEAIFGFFTHLTGYVLLPETGKASESRMGTFASRNHYGNLLAMICCLTIGLVATILFSLRNTKNSRSWMRAREKQIFSALLIGSILMFLISGILVASSRAPIVFLFLSLVLMIPLSIYFGKHQFENRQALWIIPIGVGGLIVFLIVMFGLDDAIVRLVTKDVMADERIIQTILGIPILGQFPLVGVGAGNYQWIFTMYKDEQLRFATYDHAHNDYLQVLLEQGIIGFFLLAIAVGIVTYKIIRGYMVRRDPLIKGVLFGSLMVIIFMGMHATVEFNFRIPANAMYFYIILGLGLAAAQLDRSKRRKRHRSSSKNNE